MIPSFDPVTGALPPGVHTATWAEIVARYGTNAIRLRQLVGMRRMIGALRAAGCTRVYLDGSFVTVKPIPGDFDVLWEQNAVDIDRLDPVLIDFSAQRAAQKNKYLGECFPADFIADLSGSMTYLEFFQTDMDNNRKGIISIDLRTFP